MTALEGNLWPFGFTAWRDILLSPNEVELPRPYLVAKDGRTESWKIGSEAVVWAARAIS